MNTQKKQNGNGGRTALGFFLTFFMTITLMINGLVMGVKTTILNGSDVSEVLENMNFYDVLSDLIKSELTKSSDGTDISAGEIAVVVTNDEVAISDDNVAGINISNETIEAIFGEDVLKEVTKTLTDAIKNNQDVDLSSTKDQCVANVENLAMQLIDDVVNEIQNMESDTISAETLVQLNTVQKMKNDYNVDVDTIITDYVKDNHGSDSINIADVDLEAIRTEAKDTVKNDVMPELEETIDDYMTEITETVNESIKEANASYDLSGLMKSIEEAINILGTIMLVCIIAAVLFMALEMVIYRKEINRGFRNVFISTLIAGIFTLVMSVVVGVVKGIFSSVVGEGEDAVSMAVSKLIGDNIGAVGDRVMLVAIVYIVISVACLVAAIIIKKNIKKNDDIDSMGTLGEGSVIA